MLHCSVRQKWTHSVNCVVPENMHTPSPRRATELQRERGGGGSKGDNFRGGVPSKID